MSELIPTQSQTSATSRADRSTTSPLEPSIAQPRPVLWVPRVVAAMLVAVAADAVAIPAESFPVVFDVLVGVVLTIILGPRAAVLGALVLEAIPGVGMFPSWVAAVAWVAYSQGRRKP
jgi:hypothetical protein